MLDGVKDGLLENPTRCTFDPKEIECKSGDAPNCLTTTQVEAVRKIYAGPTNPRTNERIWSPLYRGSELDWSFFTESAGPIGIATSALRMILGDPTWDYRKTPVDFDRHVALADRSDIARVSASNPDISAVRAARRQADSLGRLEQRARAGRRRPRLLQQRSKPGLASRTRSAAVRLYMVPGMIECNGGPGTDTFDMLGVMRRWVERGEAPNDVLASRVEHGKVVRTRPLCPYPQVATYRGSGSTDDAGSFVCR